MSNKKQSSVEWLIYQLTEVDYNCINKTFLQNNNSLAGNKMKELFQQAKTMHKQEIVDATCLNDYVNEDDREIGERYYNETFNQ